MSTYVCVCLYNYDKIKQLNVEQCPTIKGPSIGQLSERENKAAYPLSL